MSCLLKDFYPQITQKKESVLPAVAGGLIIADCRLPIADLKLQAQSRLGPPNIAAYHSFASKVDWGRNEFRV
jgi:hypothetical protein